MTMNDAIGLEHLGYKQELTRSLNRLTNYGMTLSVVSISSGITSLFGYGLITGGPVVMVWGWFFVSILTLCVSLGMAEICSAYPTAGGLYFWAANLVPEKYKSIASWYTGWFNLVGQFAAIASVDFGLSMLIASVISIGIGQWSPSPWHIVLIHLVVVISHGLCNSMGSRFFLWITHLSTWWQLLAPVIVAITLYAGATKGPHYSGTYAFTTYVNRTGWTNIVYVCLIGLLQAQFCLSGYDSAAHMSEETKRANVAGPWGMITAVIGSSLMGWFFIISLIMGIHDYEQTVKTKTGFPVTQILLDNFGRSWTLLLMSCLLLACWFCGLVTVTSNSRMIYAFSRDNAMPFSFLWNRVNIKLACPLNAVWLSCTIAFLLGLPYLIDSTAYTAVASLCTICLYVSYGLPLLCKIFSPTSFPRGPFHLGRFSFLIHSIALIWIFIIVILFILPPEYPVTPLNMNYASVGFATVLISSSLFYFFSAQYWFVGPPTHILKSNASQSSIITQF